MVGGLAKMSVQVERPLASPLKKMLRVHDDDEKNCLPDGYYDDEHKQIQIDICS